MQELHKKLVRVFIFLGSTIGLLLFVSVLITTSNNTRDIRAIESGIEKMASSTDGQIAILQKQISSLNENLSDLTGESQKVAVSIKELTNRQSVKQKSQEDLVTSAVSSITPSVVSVIATKDVPKVEVVYQNPFGDDPLFKDFNIQVPVIRQKGVAPAQVGAASGFIVTSDGYIVTNRHVVLDEAATYAVFLSDGRNKQASVIYRDPTNDVAIIKIDGANYNPVTLSNSGLPKLGQTVIAIGNALGEYNNSVSIGIISGLNRTITAGDANGNQETLTGVLQTDAATNPGNSGGPLIDLSGNVIGINVATVIGSNSISFTIPINVVKTVLKTALGRSF